MSRLFTESWRQTNTFFEESFRINDAEHQKLAVKSTYTSQGNQLKVSSKNILGIKGRDWNHYFNILYIQRNGMISMDLNNKGDIDVETEVKLAEINAQYIFSAYFKGNLKQNEKVRDLNTEVGFKAARFTDYLYFGVTDFDPIIKTKPNTCVLAGCCSIIDDNNQYFALHSAFKYDLKLQGLSEFEFLLKEKRKRYEGLWSLKYGKSAAGPKEASLGLKFVRALNLKSKIGLDLKQNLSRRIIEGAFIISSDISGSNIEFKLNSKKEVEILVSNTDIDKVRFGLKSRILGKDIKFGAVVEYHNI